MIKIAALRFQFDSILEPRVLEIFYFGASAHSSLCTWHAHSPHAVSTFHVLPACSRKSSQLHFANPAGNACPASEFP